MYHLALTLKVSYISRTMLESIYTCARKRVSRVSYADALRRCDSPPEKIERNREREERERVSEREREKTVGVNK